MSARIRRWLDLAWYAVSGLLAFEILLPLGESFWAKIPAPGGFAPWFLLPLTVILLFGFAFIAVEPIRVRRDHWRHVLRYPPLWFAIAIAFAAAVFLSALPLVDQPVLAVGWPDVGIVSIVTATFIGAVALRHARWSNGDDAPRRAPAPLDVSTWDVMRAWFAAEQPTELDLFDHADISERLARTLLDDDNRQSVALLGMFGSGKSSVLARVRRELTDSDDPKVIVAEFNGWAVPQPSDAPRVALERVIDGLGNVVDVQQFRELPEAYKRLVAAAPTGLLEKLFGTTSGGDPLAELRRIEPVLDALDARLVLLVEDADRAGDQFDSRHLARLLATLRGVRRVSFVLSIDANAEVRFDYRKLCDIVEIIPLLDPERVFGILSTAHHHWMTEVPFIDPRTKKESRLGLGQGLDEMAAYVRRLTGDASDALTILLESPRRIKHLIRRVDRVWSNLRGEVDLDELIVLSVLRDITEINVLEFMDRNIDVARSDPSDGGGGGFLRRDIRPEWRALLERSPNHRDAIQRLVDVLGIRQLSSSTHAALGSSDSVQSVSSTGQTDYFRRIMQERLAPDEVSDQEVLADIDRWVQTHDGELVARLSRPTTGRSRYVDVWEQFAWRIEDEDLFTVSDRLLDEVLRRDRNAAGMENEPALLAVWRQLNRRPQTDNRAVAWLQAQIKRSLPVSMRLADDLLYFWTGKHGIVSETGRIAVRRAMLDDARLAFTDPHRLLATLTDREGTREGYALVHFVRPPGTRETIDIEPRDRAWLVPLLIESAKLKPALVIRNLIHMIGDQEPFADLPELDRSTLLERIYHLHPEQAEKIFGEQTGQVLQLIASSALDDDVSRSAARQAKKYLQEKGNAPSTTSTTSDE